MYSRLTDFVSIYILTICKKWQFNITEKVTSLWSSVCCWTNDRQPVTMLGMFYRVCVAVCSRVCKTVCMTVRSFQCVTVLTGRPVNVQRFKKSHLNKIRKIPEAILHQLLLSLLTVSASVWKGKEHNVQFRSLHFCSLCLFIC